MFSIFYFPFLYHGVSPNKAFFTRVKFFIFKIYFDDKNRMRKDPFNHKKNLKGRTSWIIMVIMNCLEIV